MLADDSDEAAEEDAEAEDADADEAELLLALLEAELLLALLEAELLLVELHEHPAMPMASTAAKTMTSNFFMMVPSPSIGAPGNRILPGASPLQSVFYCNERVLITMRLHFGPAIQVFEAMEGR